MKQQSFFYKNPNININYDKYTEIEDSVKWWMTQSYDQLYNLMFSNSLLRSWFVLSYGNCPSCNKPVLLYNWKLDAKNYPFKVQCPHCNKLFPENDFEAFYKSGLDTDGKFSYDLANRKLLGDYKYIDDGNGYVDENGETYLFIAYYLARGHWEQLITDGINNLALAYLVTKNKEYARRAMLLFYSVSRFYSDFDFKSEGVMYEKRNKSNGYVNYWVNSCNDIRYFSLSYDMIFDCIKNDTILSDYLKISFSEIQHSIEENIFIDATKNVHKIFSNPPTTDMALLYIKIILSWDTKKDEILSDLYKLIEKNTLIDGMPGEKGIIGYAALGPNLLMELFNQLSLLEPNLISEILNKYPILYKTYRFHIDSWYMNKYYPHCGDTSSFNEEIPLNASLKHLYNRNFQKFIKPTANWFAYMLYKQFNDIDFLKVIYINNNYSYDNLFKDDLFLSDKEKNIIINQIKTTIDKTGPYTNQKSINYSKYRMAFLHQGKKENKRMAFMIYESGANHSHNEALNIGLFFKGKNIMSGFGYPPVGYGNGWFSDEVKWYWHTSSHNIVVIDNKNHTNVPTEITFLRYPKYGKTLLFESNDLYDVVCAEAKEYADAKKYERLLAMINIDEYNSYVIDIFKVDGGNSHRKFQRSSFFNIKYENLNLQESTFDEYKFMRNFKTDINPSKNYSITFYDDDTSFKYTDLTTNVKTTICESWVNTSKAHNDKSPEYNIWIPTLMIEHNGPKSTFVSIMEVFNSNSHINNIKRKGNDDIIILEVLLENGDIDYISFDNNYNFSVKRSKNIEKKK